MKIPLTKGQFALIDDADAHLVSHHKWYANKNHNTYYALYTTSINGKRQWVLMHRLILGLKKGELTDHINGNGLDNRRRNLRKCTNAENTRNRYARKGKSKYKGVSWHISSKGWRAQIRTDGGRLHLGCFKTEIEAAHIYDKAAIEHHGKFAHTNFQRRSDE